MIRRIMQGVWRAIVRISAIAGKETRIILHQPRLVFSLILGPFLILLIFGMGYRNTIRNLDTLIVVPPGSEVAPYVQEYSGSLRGTIKLAGITDDLPEARQRLRSGEVDLVVATPRDPLEEWESDEQSSLTLYHNEIDPLEEGYIAVAGQQLAQAINQEILYSVVSDSQAESSGWRDSIARAKEKVVTTRQALEAGDRARAEISAESLGQELDALSLALGSGSVALAGLGEASDEADLTSQISAQMETLQWQSDQLIDLIENDSMLEEGTATVSEVEASLEQTDELLLAFQDVDPNILVAPFGSKTTSLTEVDIDPMHFYVPAVIALLLQHLAITLAGLSIIREKLIGAFELFQASPASALEILVGKYASYLLLLGLIAAALTGLIVLGLKVPQLGTWSSYVLVILALLLFSLGIGFHISLSARSDSQAIQYGMLTLLAAIFFSGFFLPLYRLAPGVRVISWLLPATYGTELLQNVMLRGQPPQLLLIVALLFLAFFLMLLSWFRLRRQMAQA